MSTSLSIKGKTQGNEAVTSTINYVNPNATSAQLVSLATAMNNLTTNTVSDITRIDKNSLVNTIEKQDRNLQLSQSTIAAADISEDISSPTRITLSGADISLADLRVSKPNENNTYIFLEWITDSGGSGDIYIEVVGDAVSTASASNIVFEVPETDTYKAASVTLSITNS